MVRFMFKTGRYLVAILAYVAVAGCGAVPKGPLAKDPYGWNASGKIVQLLELGGSAELQDGLKRMARGDVYFGALHVDKESERFAYARNWNSIEAAIAVSAAVCAEAAGRQCTLAAVALPSALPSETRRAKGFSVQTLKNFQLVYARAQRPGLWGAYAISPVAAQGFSAQEPTKDAARRKALSNCTYRLDWELEQIGPIGAAAARRGNHTRCEVVHVTPPG